MNQVTQEYTIVEADVLVESVKPDSSYEITKRVVDVTLSILGIVVALPLMILIAIAVKLDSRGPILFRQQRIGQNKRQYGYFNVLSGGFQERRNAHDLRGQPFHLYKFRSMSVKFDSYAVSPKNVQDRRITRVGKLIRPLCLDELPQLFNVLKGDMSLVGPRPEMSFIVDSYGIVETQRLLGKPGITGPWQLYGSRDKHIHEEIEYDLEYLRDRSILFDLQLLARTAKFALSSKNA